MEKKNSKHRSRGEEISEEQLAFLIENVFLPPELPQNDDDGPRGQKDKNLALLNLLADTADEYHRHIEGPAQCKWNTITKMLRSLLMLKKSEQISAEILGGLIQNMECGDVLVLHVTAQNAGLILRHTGSDVTFESFEVSPTAAEVIGTNGSLLCSFPGPAISVPENKVKDHAFLAEFASFLSQVDGEELNVAMPATVKAGANVREIRDTAHPKIITTFLTGVLRAMGRPEDPVVRIRKRIRDDVLWQDARRPWRRSPLWLVLRVALQTTLQHDKSGNGNLQYKAFLIFFMTSLLDLAHQQRLPSDYLFVMNAKLGRRVHKVGSGLPDFVFEKAKSTINRVAKTLARRWKEQQVQESKSSTWRPEELCFEDDTLLSLQNSRSYLANVLSRKNSSQQGADFRPEHFQRIASGSDTLPDISVAGTLTGSGRLIALMDFEHWIEEHLKKWLDANRHREMACEQLGKALQDYTMAGKLAYDKNPEGMSQLILTAVTLWSAIDTVALIHCPLLSEYVPEIPVELFEPLLLPTRSQLQQLHDIEEHLRQRWDEAIPDRPSILSNKVTSDSFAARFFDTSVEHQKLRRAIESKAETERLNKRVEHGIKSSEYQKLLQKASNAWCTGRYSRRGNWYHPNWCEKCASTERAHRMRIDVHEWPLPADQTECKQVIFELLLPLAFSVWRDTTFKILADICSPELSHGSPVKVYGELRSSTSSDLYVDFVNREQRITLASKTKSFTQSHYNNVSFPTELEDILVPNGLKPELFDSRERQWASDCLGKSNVSPICTLELPHGPYKNLQYSVSGHQHTSNEVLAAQSECASELSLHEYEAFTTLRSGHRLHWLNIARELWARNLSFGKSAVNILISQTTWQVGPADVDDVLREAHVELAQPEFCRTLLCHAGELLGDIEGNWLEQTCAQTLIAITARVLSLCTDSDVKESAQRLLRKARDVALAWTKMLSRKLQDCDDEAESQNLQLRVLTAAAICRYTYDVGRVDLPLVLNNDDDVSTAISMAIIVHDHSPIDVQSLPLDVRYMLDRDRRLAHVLEPELRRLSLAATRSGRSLDQSVKQAWSGYYPGTQWKLLDAPNDRWVTTMTGRKDARYTSLAVHYNFLSGQLLVNGGPLCRLPSNFLQHPTYRRIFGDKLFDVAPSRMPGMDYQTKLPLHGYEIDDPVKHPEGRPIEYELFFALLDGELIIRTSRKGSCDSKSVDLELVPYEKLQGDFPRILVDKYCHWMDIATGTIEFRPLDKRWTETPENWRMDYSASAATMYLGCHRLIDVRSKSASMIKSILCPIEDSEFTEVTLEQNGLSGVCFVRLPRLKLEFFVNSNYDLECRQFREMIVDSNQFIGTFVGLQNKLVLRGLAQNTVSRKVIVPYGTRITPSVSGWGSQVGIQRNGLEFVDYYTYDVDTKLHRLVGNNCLASRLYKIYLHALTAHCLPDELTGRTGTEEALYDMRSAATWSFQKLDAHSREAQLLEFIQSLTPRRTFYPKHLKVMQTVIWGDLPMIAQHDEFYRLVQSLVAYARRFDIFREQTATPLDIESESSEALLDRAAIRNSVFRVHEFGGSLYLDTEDKVYQSRDIIPAEEAKIFQIVQCVEHGAGFDHPCPDLMGKYKEWGSLGRRPIKLGYSSEWLAKADLSDSWCTLYDTYLGSMVDGADYPLCFLLCTLAFGNHIDMQVIWTLVTIAKWQAVLDIPYSPGYGSSYQYLLPEYDKFNFGYGFEPNEGRLIKVIQNHASSFENSPHYSNTARYTDEDDIDYRERRMEQYHKDLRSQSQTAARFLMGQWRCQSVALPNKSFSVLYMDKAEDDISHLFQMWYQNSLLEEHTAHVQHLLYSQTHLQRPRLSTYTFEPCRKAFERTQPLAQMVELFQSQAPVLFPSPPMDPSILSKNPDILEKDLSAILLEEHPVVFERQRLELFVEELKLNASAYGTFEHTYATDLSNSLSAFQEQDLRPQPIIPSLSALEKHVELCQDHMDRSFLSIRKSLLSATNGNGSAELLRTVGISPPITPTSILRNLTANSHVSLSAEWTHALVSYGQAIARLQRAERLFKLASQDNESEFFKEAENTGHDGWDPMDQARHDWLLMEIDNDMLIRPVQAHIASEMISPSSGDNSLLQLNMGEGKSSVIVPIIAATLASLDDGSNLARVLVLKPLATQMFRLLVQKLGDLADRRIFYLPFSRSVQLTADTARNIFDLYKECVAVKGILVAQPEHLLSLKLMGLEQLLDEKNSEVGRTLLDLRTWLDERSRDVLDESDEILHVRYQLIYTIGAQRPMECSPDRWIVIQQVFDLIGECISDLHARFPTGFEVSWEQTQSIGSFPTVRILQNDAGRALTSKLAIDIECGRLPAVSFRSFPKALHKLVLRFIQDASMTEEESRPLLDYVEDAEVSRATLLLLRGLIAHGIINTVLQDKRWRVDYGLDTYTFRSMLAVPFRAKDNPAPRAEYSHPDVVIALSCITYYYTGLTDAQLEACFEMLFKLDNFASVYESWLNNGNIARAPDIRGINLEDFEQRTERIFPLFRYNKGIIDFYLSSVVFAREAREFPYKLSTSGWDLADSKHAGQVTGFSGTNDNRYLLPLSIEQHDLPEQLGTNAKVLHYLLQPENDGYVCASGPDGDRAKIDKLLEMIVAERPRIRVILDVGAQVLEWKNHQVAAYWLSLVKSDDTQAAVYFDDEDELTVVTRDGSTELLLLSPFAKQMDRCLVYLDEAHTRGTDLKLPRDSKAAVTLGPNLTKDRLVQACMRMRQLGHGQSVMFVAPPEIDRKISEASNKSDNTSQTIKAVDVVRWAISETIKSTKHNVALWASQGLSYQTRQGAWLGYCDGSVKMKKLEAAMLEQEAQTLEELYGFVAKEDPLTASTSVSEQRCDQVRHIQRKCHQFGIKSLRGTRQQEEQEREIMHEAEHERQVERPPKMDPHQHMVHPRVRWLVQSGILIEGSTPFLPAFESLCRTSADKYWVEGWPGTLLVTEDYATTIKTKRKDDKADEYLRPVKWILSIRNRKSTLVIISPYEANTLLPDIRQSPFVQLHIYAPRTTKAMRSCQDLSFYTIPGPVSLPVATDLVLWLDLFAGQLYFHTQTDYTLLSALLALYIDNTAALEEFHIETDGFVKVNDRFALHMKESSFEKSPVAFLRRLLAFRRKGQDYLDTHIGQLLHNRLLFEKDFS